MKRNSMFTEMVYLNTLIYSRGVKEKAVGKRRKKELRKVLSLKTLA